VNIYHSAALTSSSCPAFQDMVDGSLLEGRIARSPFLRSRFLRLFAPCANPARLIFLPHHLHRRDSPRPGFGWVLAIMGLFAGSDEPAFGRSALSALPSALHLRLQTVPGERPFLTGVGVQPGFLVKMFSEEFGA